MSIKIYCAHDEIQTIKKLKPNPDNPNKHPTSQIKLLAKIIKTNGWRQPITISTRSGLITKGHGRLAAAKMLKCNEIPIDLQDYASAEEERADMLADNKLTELSMMDDELLKLNKDLLEMADYDLELAGFEFLEIPDFQPIDEDEQPRLDRKEPIICPECGHSFEK